MLRDRQTDSASRGPGVRTHLWLLIAIGLLAVIYLGLTEVHTLELADTYIQRSAHRETEMAAAFRDAVRAYVEEHIQPRMAESADDNTCRPDVMSSAYVATKVLDRVGETFPELLTRTTTLEPRNPKNQPNEVERRIIAFFDEHPHAQAWSSAIDLHGTGQTYFIHATPRRLGASCLRCHGDPADASTALIEAYGDTAGFGRSAGDVAIDYAAIPVTAAYAEANAVTNHHLIASAGLCGLFLLGIGLLGYVHHRQNRLNAAMLMQREAHLRSIVEGSPNCVLSFDAHGRFQTVNFSGLEALGLTEAQLIGRPFVDIWPAQARPYMQQAVTRVLDGEKVAFETEYVRLGGRVLTWWLALNPIQDARDGGVSGFVGIATDITARKEAERQLLIDARTDALTGLTNRVGLCECLQAIVQRSWQDTAERFAVIFLDFDRFKIINDSLGHEAGDDLLVQIASRLRATMTRHGATQRLARDATVARFGGDEFVVLLEDLDAPSDALRQAEDLLSDLNRPYMLGSCEVHSTASLGIRIGDGGDAVGELLRDADTAMYESKLAGRGRCTVFDDSMRQRIQRRAMLEQDLRKAIDRDEMFLVYQPIVSLDDGTIRAFEALLRWRHGEHGVISPGEFIPIAEENGTILDLGQWVLEAACAQSAAWQRDTGRAVSVNVNLSRNQLCDPTLCDTVRSVLAQTGLPPTRVQLEVTESTIMDNVGQVLDTLKRLKALGIELAMDDFGTGYSSLACLHDLPVDVLKIDRSFIRGIDGNRDFAAMVHAVSGLSENLGIAMVAEGIETAEQLALLQAMDCACGQGFLFSAPMAAEDVPGFEVDRGLFTRRAEAA